LYLLETVRDAFVLSSLIELQTRFHHVHGLETARLFYCFKEKSERERKKKDARARANRTDAPERLAREDRETPGERESARAFVFLFVVVVAASLSKTENNKTRKYDFNAPR
jgi:hypothetical protein